MKKYKIAYVGLKGLPAISGADRVVENIINNLDKNYFEVVIYCMKDYIPEGYVPVNFNQIIIRRFFNNNLGTFLFFIFSGIHALFKNYNLVHLHNIDCAFILPILNLKYKRKLISTSHGRPQDREKWSIFAKFFFRRMENIFLKYSKVVTSVSKPLKEDYEKKIKKEIIYIPNGINLNDNISITLAENKLNISEVKKDFLLFASGRIIPTKGAHILLQAVKEIGLKNRLVVIGDIMQIKEYGIKIMKLINQTCSKYLGFITSKADLLGFISQAKLFVFPSSVEAMSMMLLEAASVKTPIICSNIPENTSVFNNKEVLFFNVNDVNDLKEKIIWANKNPNNMKKKAQRAYTKLARIYSWDNIVSQYSKLYKKTIQGQLI
ncbi:glycosyltransferase family 4 protein [Spirochaetota bacterium]